jgi:hypothetical protein
MTTVPASAFVKITPNVLNAGGNGLELIGLMLTTSARVPMGTVAQFLSQAEVADYFGGSSQEAKYATNYFAGFDISTIKPAALLMAQYNQSAVAAYIRSGNIGDTTVADFAALSPGSFDVVVDGFARTAPGLDLSGATTFSNIATTIAAALNASVPAAATLTGSIGGHVTASTGATTTGTGAGTTLTVTGTTGVIHPGPAAVISGIGVPANTHIVSQSSGSPGGDGDYVTNNATTSVSAAITVKSNVLDVTAVPSGTIQVTDVLSGAGVTADTTVLAQLTGAAGGIGTYALSTDQHFASEDVTCLSTVLNVTAVGSGALVVGSPIAGTNVTADTVVTAFLTGAGSTGTYTVSQPSTTVSEAMTSSATNVTCVFDSTANAFVLTSGLTGVPSTVAFATGDLAADLFFTLNTNAVLSQGAAPAAPASFMDGIVIQSQNWASFMTLFDPDNSGNANKLLFSKWNAGQEDRWVYVAWDTDTGPSQSAPDTNSLGYKVNFGDGNQAYSGTALIGQDMNAPATYDPVAVAAMVCGSYASVNFDQPNGRTTMAFRSQLGLIAGVTSLSAYQNLIANGYSGYTAVATANQGFVFLANGQISGKFKWQDSYINQIWLNNAFQLAFMEFLVNTGSIPYNQIGYSLIGQAAAGVINAGLDFGAFRAGVTLSPSQIIGVNTDAGVAIASILASRGWYLQILDASANVRLARGSPPMKFWYMDGESVQMIDMQSIVVQ